MYKTVEITCFTKVVYVLDFPVRWLFFCGPNEPQICWLNPFQHLHCASLNFDNATSLPREGFCINNTPIVWILNNIFFDILPPAHKLIALNRSRVRDSWQRWLLGSVLLSLAQLKSDETRWQRDASKYSNRLHDGILQVPGRKWNCKYDAWNMKNPNSLFCASLPATQRFVV